MYAIKVNSDGRIAYATYPEFAVNEKEEWMEGYIHVPTIPDGDLSCYRYADGEFIHDPQNVEPEIPALMDRIEAQVAYTAMMTDTLLEV